MRLANVLQKAKRAILLLRLLLGSTAMLHMPLADSYTQLKDALSFMPILSIPYSDDLLVATGQSPEALEQEFRLLLAIKLFELQRLSLGKAAEVAGMSRIHFMDELGRMHIPVINLADDQIQDELRDN